MTFRLLLSICTAGLAFCLWRASKEWGIEKPKNTPIPPDHQGMCVMCKKIVWVDYPNPHHTYYCAWCRPGGGKSGDGA